MGSGKSTLGPALARALNFRFIDVDHAIEEQQKKSIPEIFEQHGEKYFRQIESKMIAELCHRDKAVIATGGGAVLDRTNREIMQHASVVIFLRAKMTTLMERTRGDTNRPLLQTSDPLATMTDIYRQREPYYLSTAQFVIDTDSKTIDDVVSEIQNALE